MIIKNPIQLMVRGVRIELVLGDITTLQTEAIVNAASENLLGGKGVDGAIHKAAGPELLEECLKIGGCPSGEARITKGYNLNSKYVIHAVGPIYKDGNHGEASLLEKTYLAVFQLVKQYKIKSVALPAISTGTYNFPKYQGIKIAIETTFKFLKQPDSELELIVFVAHNESDYSIYDQLLNG